MPTSPRWQRRHDAVAFVVARMGSDLFTTHEVAEKGREMLSEASPWPRGLKAAWKSLNTTGKVASILARHPDFGKVDGGGYKGVLDLNHKGVRIRSQLWERR